jgi:putative transposase
MELYHALNRGVERRTLFEDDMDRARFVHDLYEFNDTAPANNDRRLASMIEIRSQSSGSRNKLVELHGWCLMGNHYHLLISEVQENGMSLFLRKLNVGYAMYFNEKYSRTGTLFQGRTKRIRIASDAHFLHILHYIHLNPLDFSESAKDWREMRIKNEKEALEHLRAYRWSSFLDYFGEKNFPSILTRDLFDGVFKNYKKVISDHLGDLKIQEIAPLLLE